MANIKELFRRLEDFEKFQQELVDQKEDMATKIQSLEKDIEEVRGIAEQLKLYFDTVSNQNKQLMSPKTQQSEISMNDVIKLVRELKDD